MRGICKAARRQTKQSTSIKEFQSYKLTIYGKKELKTFTSFETNGKGYAFPASQMLAGLYMNELILKLLPIHDPHDTLFQLYEQSLQNLMEKNQTEQYLRLFERHLLSILGYEMNFNLDNINQPICPHSHYSLSEDWRFLRVPVGIPGHCLLQMANKNYSEATTLHYAKILARQIFARLIEGGMKSYAIAEKMMFSIPSA